ncbi:hypothetical protein [Azorhizobium sp. AG788]|uniref:hypothetical protein n=1 Tax=Azorhizobium sp. AG788 TaxID=2183897 RepID=UPI00105F39DC|nr:hypothetical protein [Azorhizobium sp. AG788]
MQDNVVTSLERIEQAFCAIDDNFDNLMQNASDDQRRQLVLARNVAKHAYDEALAKELTRSNRQIDFARQRLIDATNLLKDAINNQRSIAECIQLATSAASLAASLVIISV